MITKKKIVLITGAESGIGKSTSKIFSNNGYEVIGTSLKKINNKSKDIEYYQIDITNNSEWKNLSKIIKKKHGKIDVLVNSAGVFTYGAIEDTSYEEFKNVWRSNVDSVLLGMKHLLPSLEQASGVASVVNVSSLSGGRRHSVDR